MTCNRFSWSAGEQRRHFTTSFLPPEIGEQGWQRFAQPFRRGHRCCSSCLKRTGVSQDCVLCCATTVDICGFQCFQRHGQDCIDILVCFSRESYHEIQFEIMPPFFEETHESLFIIRFGEILVDNSPESFGSSFGCNRKAGFSDAADFPEQ